MATILATKQIDGFSSYSPSPELRTSSPSDVSVASTSSSEPDVAKTAVKIASLDELRPLLGADPTETQINDLRARAASASASFDHILGRVLIGPQGERVLQLLSKPIEEGSCKKVFHAINLTNATRMAVAVCDFTKAPPDFAARLQKQLERDIYFAQPEQQAEHIVRTHFVLKEGPKTYIAMEYCEGGDLCTYLIDLMKTPKAERPPIQARVKIALRLAQILQKLHDDGILHNDVKPENFLFRDKNGELVVADFGFAVDTFEEQESSGSGTAEYRAPELWRGAPASINSDVWALGIVLYNLLTSATLHYKIPDVKRCLYWHGIQNVTEAQRQTHIENSIKSLTDGMHPVYPDECFLEIEQLLNGALEVNPAKRWSLAKIIEKLEFIDEALSPPPAVEIAAHGGVFIHPDDLV